MEDLSDVITILDLDLGQTNKVVPLKYQKQMHFLTSLKIVFINSVKRCIFIEFQVILFTDCCTMSHWWDRGVQKSPARVRRGYRWVYGYHGMK